MRPTGPFEVELADVEPPGQNQTAQPVQTDQTAQTEKQQIELEPTFCTHVGWGGTFVFLFSALVASFIIVVIALYADNGKWGRPGIWVLWILFVVYILFVVKCFWLWRKLANRFIKEHQTIQNRTPHRKNSAVERLFKSARETKNFCGNLQINGSLYLWKLYASELLESAMQCRNFLITYSCVFPLGGIVFFSVLLAIDCAHSAWSMVQENNPSRRIRRVTIDLVIDFICGTLPLCVSFLGYGIPLTISETLWLLFLPLFAAVHKLDDIFEEIIRARTAAEVFKLQGKKAAKQKRRRESIFVDVRYLYTAKLQDERMPKKLKQVAAICKALFAFFFFATAVVSLAMYSDVSKACNVAFGEVFWENGCQLKVPFCHRFFEPRCNCAVFDLENHNESRLPETFTEWIALRRLRIHNGPLEELPSNMGGNLKNIADLQITNNRLKSFDVNIKGWTSVITLRLYNNNIRYIHKSVFQSKSIVNLDVASNVNLSLFEDVTKEHIHMPSLNYFNLGNNSVAVPLNLFGFKQFPRLKFLHLDGNHILKFFDNFKSLSNTLERFTASRCNIVELPSYMKSFESIYRFDVRNNNISYIDLGLLNALKNNENKPLFEVLFATNPICEDSAMKEMINAVDKKSCDPLCSIYCYSRNAGGNGYCNTECNSKDCDYDGGDCLI
eukprot:g8250.t1